MGRGILSGIGFMALGELDPLHGVDDQFVYDWVDTRLPEQSVREDRGRCQQAYSTASTIALVGTKLCGGRWSAHFGFEEFCNRSRPDWMSSSRSDDDPIKWARVIPTEIAVTNPNGDVGISEAMKTISGSMRKFWDDSDCRLVELTKRPRPAACSLHHGTAYPARIAASSSIIAGLNSELSPGTRASAHLPRAAAATPARTARDHTQHSHH